HDGEISPSQWQLPFGAVRSPNRGQASSCRHRGRGRRFGCVVGYRRQFRGQLWVNKTGREEVPDGVDGTDPTDGPYSPGLMEQILSELTPVVPLKRGKTPHPGNPNRSHPP